MRHSSAQPPAPSRAMKTARGADSSMKLPPLAGVRRCGGVLWCPAAPPRGSPGPRGAPRGPGDPRGGAAGHQSTPPHRRTPARGGSFIDESAPRAVFIARDGAGGWAELCRMITAAHADGSDRPLLPRDALGG
ncbi:hypothetical protein, partial [Streptomyces albus]|uniref:hypothetical protein n=1 Tax=Streptomyces albus TaxID=1888 RepID=UPI001969A899